MAKDTAEEKDDAGAAGAKKKKMIIMAVLALVVLGGVYKFVLAKPDPAAAAAAEAEAAHPVAGEVLTIDPVNINLADGAYLKLGLSLQLTEAAAKAHTPPDGAPALDAAITFFTGEDLASLQSKKAVAKMKAELLHDIEEQYLPHEEPKEGEEPESLVMGLYFTTFVVQSSTT